MGDISLFCHIIRELCIIFQAPVVLKLKYTKAMLRQIHIINIITANLILPEAYLANILVNPRGMSHIFYEIDLLLKYQNRKFKQF